jgi:hypothetical protein
MHAIHRTAYAAALSILVGSMAGCDTAQTTTPSSSAGTQSAHATPSASAASGSKAEATPLSQSQLAAVLLTSRDVPALQRDAPSDHFGVVTLRYVADTGGPECNVFLNAINTPETTYHSLGEVDRGYQLAGPQGEVPIDTQMTTYSSAANAQRIVTDIRSSAKDCSNLHYTLNGNSLAYHNVTSMPLPTVGDDSTAIQATFTANNSAPVPVAMDMIRVGTVAVGVWVYDDPNPYPLLLQAAHAVADKIRQTEDPPSH